MVGYSDVAPASQAPAAPSVMAPSCGTLTDDRTGSFGGQDALGGALEGVTPVALSLPSYTRSMYADRELVTRERAFRPVLVYVTDWALRPLVILWLIGAGLLIAAYRAAITSVYRRIAERLAPKPAPAGDEPPPKGPDAEAE
jgi:hypothetical protein